jgi:AcrR family transcriptional regulator
MTKQEIIEAAFKVWGRDFYRKTSLSQIARELGVSKPALYRHFENKQALTAAMSEHFFNGFAVSVRADFEKALQINNIDEGIFTIVQSISGYLARNVYHLVFFLVNINDRNIDSRTIPEQFKNRGTDLGVFRLIIQKKYDTTPATMQLIFASIVFYMTHFHETNKSFEKSPSDKEISDITRKIFTVIKNGLGFPAEQTGSLDLQKLEVMVDGTLRSEEPEPLFKAVAEAVAEAGPWDTSMDMVAKRMGLSKSSLYGHFKNRKDMLRRLFLNEFKRIIEFARQGISLSPVPAQQLYLGIYSIAFYLHSRHEVLEALNWIRTRKLDLGKPEKKMEIFFRLFEDVEIDPFKNSGEEEKRKISHLILFLLINILMRPYMSGNKDLSVKDVRNDDIRLLYKFITLGLGGFIR